MSQLKNTLDRIGLKQVELARLLDVSPRTVSMWATGDAPVPGPVDAYLRVLENSGPDTVASELGRLKGRHKAFDEGIYMLSYADPNAKGHAGGDALAVLRAGRIIGSDRWGGLFEGSYRFDSVHEANHFHVRIKVPPEGELVNGIVAGRDGALLDVVAVLDRATPEAVATVDIGGRPVALRLAYLGPIPN
ncbi:MAG: hypothetical protein NW216_06495 [Hyphomicrobium sp.]|nr:hypothetical protein [Hyphomicrobium sp.]